MPRRIFYSLLFLATLVSAYYGFRRDAKKLETTMLSRIESMDTSAWVGSSPNHIPVETENGNLSRYGYELIAYFQIFRAKRNGATNHQRNELSKLSFRSRD